MVKFDTNNIVFTCKRNFHRVAIAKYCSRNTAKKYIRWAVAITKYSIPNCWLCFEDYRDYRIWKKENRGKQ